MKTLRRISLIPIICIIVMGVLSGQEQDIIKAPIDSTIRYGKLDNGLTYYIKSNKEPEKRASFYIIQNVGSLLENDNQNGLAHFLEHMAFNGTLHFPKRGIINTLEKYGVAFGYNINASTYYYETVYYLSDIPIEEPLLADTCLLILNDWSNYLSLTEEEIDAERGVIIEEGRTNRNSSFRLMKQYMPILLKGSKYPERDIIGDDEIIRTFEYETLRDYYHKWYRTDLQAIAIVGDFDANIMEQKVKELFSRIPAIENPEPLPFFEIPEHKETLYVLATDKEATQHSIDLYIKTKATPPENKGMDYIRERYTRSLFNSMMSARISELLQKGIPPFVTGSVNYSSFLRGYDVFSLGVSSRQNEDSLAFDAIYREAERVRRHGFTTGELERAKTNFMSSWDNYYKERDKIDNDTYASNIQSHFLINEPLASIDFEYNNVKEVLPTITLGELSGKAKIWMTPENRVIIVQGPEADGEEYLTEEQAHSIITNITSSQIDPYEDSSSEETLINESLPGSRITGTKNLEKFDAVEWTLGNGVKVVFRHADYEKDNVSLTAYSPGGISLVDDQYIPSAQMLPGLISSYGAGNFDNISLQKLLTGKKVSVTFSLGALNENISASATPKDIEAMFQLLYLKFEKPRFDREAHDALISRYESVLLQMSNNPQKIMQDSISMILSDYHTRTRIFDNDYIKEVDFGEIQKIYADRFRDADDFTFIIVGNIEEKVLKPLVEKYIGSLTSSVETEEWIDWKIDPPDGLTEKVINIAMTDPKATVMVNFLNNLEYNPYNRQAVRIINGILNLRYDATIREEEGGSYGVSTTVSISQYPEHKSNTSIFFECDPDRAAELKTIVYKEINKLYNNGPEQEDLDKTISNILKTRDEARQHNSYWLSNLYSYYYRGIDFNDPANYEDIVRNFTAEDIKKVAAEMFVNANVVDLIFKPLEKKE